MNKKIVVIDLDGTLFDCNTFHEWMKFFFINKILSFDIVPAVNLIIVALQRALKIITHSQMKYRVLQISDKKTDEYLIAKFVDNIHPMLNKTVMSSLMKNNRFFILATAAPRLYCVEIANRYGFDYITCTNNIDVIDWKENIREIKRDNVLEFLKKNGFPTDIDEVYTDHYDDLPLMEISKKVYLINPSVETLKKVHLNNIKYKNCND